MQTGLERKNWRDTVDIDDYYEYMLLKFPIDVAFEQEINNQVSLIEYLINKLCPNLFSLEPYK